MARIIFLLPFAKDEISGGIKTTYRHAEMLVDCGFDAWVYQPEGTPFWFQTRARVLTRFSHLESDVLVFPESLNGPLNEMVRRPARKVLFCQAHYYALFNGFTPSMYRDLGFARVACQSHIAKGFLERVLGFSDVAVLPCFIDGALFFPRRKMPQIAAIPKKLPREAASIQAIFNLKYPHLAATRWDIIDNRSESETAESFGRSAIVLSLPFLESFGLVPLEAMASGAVVVGFTGYGGQEYAKAQNGFWFAPDHLEETADALAKVIMGLANNDPEIAAVRDAGLATAAHYDKANAADALKAFYGSLV